MSYINQFTTSKLYICFSFTGYVLQWICSMQFTHSDDETDLISSTIQVERSTVFFSNQWFGRKSQPTWRVRVFRMIGRKLSTSTLHIFKWPDQSYHMIKIRAISILIFNNNSVILVNPAPLSCVSLLNVEFMASDCSVELNFAELIPGMLVTVMGLSGSLLVTFFRKLFILFLLISVFFTFLVSITSATVGVCILTVTCLLLNLLFS